MTSNTHHTNNPTTNVVHDQMLDYCQNTSLHGVKYLGDIHRPRPERFLWLVALLLSIAVCAYQVQLMWVKWETSPVIMTALKASTPVWTEPYPAVTVCSLIKAKKDIFDFTAASKTEGGQSLHSCHMCQLCSIRECLKCIQSTANEETVTFLRQVAPTQSDVIVPKTWLMDEKYLGRSIFTPILTEEGVCYTFNMLDVKELFTDEAVQSDHRYMNSTEQPKSEWTQEEGYSPVAGIATFPRRALFAGRHVGELSLTLLAHKKDVDYLCTDTEQGFKVYIHNPAEMPQALHHQVITVDLNKKVAVSVLPRVTRTSEKVKQYTPLQRQCYFSSEKKLSFFRVYTLANCEMECLANYTLAACDCVPFFMPRSKNTAVCNLMNRTLCVKEFPLVKQLSTFYRESAFTIKNSSRDNWLKKRMGPVPDVSIDCKCMPTCTSHDYTVAVSSVKDYNWNEFIRAKHFSGELNAKDEKDNDTTYSTNIRITLSKAEFVETQRTELFGTTDFFANCGGLLGLCMGFSVLSLVELVYFCTISLISRFHRNRQCADNIA